MSQNRKFIELQNIGEKLEARLNDIGVFSEGQL